MILNNFHLFTNPVNTSTGNLKNVIAYMGVAFQEMQSE